MTRNQQLFEAELHFLPSAPPVQLHERLNTSGDLLGSGDGNVRGSALQGGGPLVDL